MMAMVETAGMSASSDLIAALALGCKLEMTLMVRGG